jgi:hypothetical protein
MSIVMSSFQQRPPAQTTPPAPGTPQLAPIEILQAREAALQEQISIFQQQRSVLVRQLRGRDPDMRAAAAPQLTQVDLNIAAAQTELSSVQAQIATRIPSRVTNVGRTSPPPASNRGQVSGDAVAAIMVTFILAVLMPISIGITRRLWRRTPADVRPPAPDLAHTMRLERIEHAVDAIAIEVERIAEGQRFMTKVMTDRPVERGAARVAPMPEPHDASAAGEPKPFLALGAGPIEPIRVAERQAVKQSVTPH